MGMNFVRKWDIVVTQIAEPRWYCTVQYHTLSIPSTRFNHLGATTMCHSHSPFHHHHHHHHHRHRHRHHHHHHHHHNNNNNNNNNCYWYCYCYYYCYCYCCCYYHHHHPAAQSSSFAEDLVQPSNNATATRHSEIRVLGQGSRISDRWPWADPLSLAVSFSIQTIFTCAYMCTVIQSCQVLNPGTNSDRNISQLVLTIRTSSQRPCRSSNRPFLDIATNSAR